MLTKPDRSRSKRAAFVFGVICTILAAASWAAGGETETFGLSPHPEVREGIRRSFRFGLAPGSSARDSVRVYNKTDRNLKVVVYASDASRSEDGTIHIPPTGSPPTSIGSWLDLETKEIQLGPKQERILRFTVTRPLESNSGGLAAIVAEEAQSDETAGDSVEIVTRVALLVRVGSAAEAEVRVRSVHLDPVIALFPERARVSAKVSNQTDARMVVVVSAQVRSITGRRFPLGPQTIELGPRQSRTVALVWDGVPRLGGLMRASVTAQYGDSEVSSRSPLAPVIPLWLLLALISAEGFVLLKRLRKRRD